MYLAIIVGTIITPVLVKAQGAPAERVYATNIVTGNSNTNNVTNSGNAIDQNPNTYATLNASSLVLGTRGRITLKFDSTLPANTTTFIQLNEDSALLDVLLGGSLGNLLGDVLGLVIGGHNFKVAAKNNGAAVVGAEWDSPDLFNSDRARMVTDALGIRYLAITPANAYNEIFVENRTGLIGDVDLDIAGAFYYSGTESCGSALATSYNVSGLTLTVLNDDQVVAEDLARAIDGDINTASSLSPGVLNVTAFGAAHQYFYFGGASRATDEFKITLSLNEELLDVNLLGSIQVILYNGANTVHTTNLSSISNDILGLLDLDLLGLLNDGNKVTFSVKPGAAFDRAELRIGSALNLSTAQQFSIWEVSRTAGTPSVQGVNSDGEIVVCVGEPVTLTALPGNSTDVIKWYDAPEGGTLLHTGTNFNVGTLAYKTAYYVSATAAGCTEESIRTRVIVDINKNPELVVNGSTVYSANIGQSVSLPSVSASNQGGGPVNLIGWQAQNGAPMSGTTAGPFTSAGTYVYRYLAQGDACTNFVDIVVYVESTDGCDLVMNRKFANTATETTVSTLLTLVELGKVENPARAANGNLTTYSTLSEPANLLSVLGETSQTLRWNQNVAPGRPVTVRLAREFTVADVVGGIMVQAYRDNQPLGDEVRVDANLAVVLGGHTDFEYTFVPTHNGVPVEYNGVRIRINSSVLGVLQTVRVYGAYYHEKSDQIADCNAITTEIRSGFEPTIPGAEIASTLTAVTDPAAAADGNINTKATLFRLVGLLGAPYLDIAYQAPVLVGDSVKMLIGSTTGLLDVGLLSGFSIQRYYGSQVVGQPIALNSSLLSLRLLGGSDKGYLEFENEQIFDRIKIVAGGVASVAEQLDVYEVTMVPVVKLPNEQYDSVNEIAFLEICAGGTITLPADGCTEVKFFDAATGGNEITLAELQALPAGSIEKVYVQAIRFGCNVGLDRRELEIRVTEVAKPVLQPAGTQGVKEGDNITLSVSNTADYAAGVTFEWYKNGTLITGQSGSSLTLNGINLTTDLGAYTVIAIAGCASPASDPVILEQFGVVSWKSYVIDSGEDFVSGGEEITYTIHVRNSGSVAVNNLIISDAIPQRTNYVPGSATAGGTFASNTVSWNGVSIPAGGTITMSFKVRVSNNLIGATVVRNTAYVKQNSSDPGVPSYPPQNNDTPTNPNTSGDPGTDIPVVQVSNIGVDKVADQARVVAGTETSFTVTLKNNGPSVLASGASIVLEERPHASVEILGWEIISGSATITSNGVNATVTTTSNLLLNAEIKVRVRAKVGAGATGNVINTIAVWRPGLPTTEPPVEDSTPPIPVDQSADLQIEKTVDNNFPFVTENITFTIVVTNNGPSNATGVIVTDELPDGYEYDTSTASVGSYNSGSGIWTIGALASGAQATLEIVGVVKASGDYINYASVTASEPDPDQDNNEDTPDDPVVPINRSDNRLEIVKNNALADGVDANILKVTLIDELGAGIANRDVTVTITYVDNAVENRTVQTNASGEAEIQVTSSLVGTVQVAVTSTGLTITGSPRSVQFVTGPVDHARSALVVTKNNALANGTDKNILEATIVDAAGHPIRNQVVSFIITDVDGNNTTRAITTNTSGKAVLEVTSSKVGQVTVAATVGGTPISGSPQSVTFIAGSVDHNRSTLEVIKNNAIADGIDENRLRATIVDASGNPIANVDVEFGIVDVEGNPTTQTIATNTSGQAVLNLTSLKIGTAEVDAIVGTQAINSSPQTVTFIAGPVDHTRSTLVVVKDNAVADGVDANILMATIVDAQGNPIANADVDFGIIDVDANSTTEVVSTNAQGQASLQVRSSKAGSVTVSAEVGGTAISGSPKTVTFVAADNLSVYKTVDRPIAIAGQAISYTITIRNNGLVALAQGDEILLKERPGADLTITDFEIISGSATISHTGNDAVVTLTGALAVSSEIKVRVSGTVSPSAKGTITNGISIWGPDTPPTEDPDDDDDTPPTPVDQVTDLAIDKSVNNARPYMGSNVVFTMVVTNHGPSDAMNVRVIDRLPSGLQYVSSTTTVGQYNPTTYRWTVGDMAAGEEQTLTITAKVLESGDYINFATVTGDDDDPDLTNNEDTPDDIMDPQPANGLRVEKTADANSVQAGGEITFTIVITNDGPDVLESGDEFILQELPSAGLTIEGLQVISGDASLTFTNNRAVIRTTAEFVLGQSITLKATAKVDADAPASISNGVKVWSPDKDPDGDDPDSETETPDIPVDNGTTLSISKTIGQSSVATGSTVSFTLTVTNNGPGILKSGKSFIVEEIPGSGIEVTGASVTSGNAALVSNGNFLTLTTSADVSKGETVVIQVDALVVADAGSKVVNGVKVWGPDKDPEDDEPDDEDTTPEIPVTENYIITVSKSADQDRLTPGSEATFTITITNQGPEAIPSGDRIFLRELPGQGLSILGYEISSGAAQIQGVANQATITTTGNIATGNSIVVKIQAKVDEQASGSISNGIAIWSNDKNPDTDTPDDEDSTDPIPVDTQISIPNLFTPNGDGLNDLFVIRGLQQYDQRELIIINRWGNQVYSNKNYNNDWDGGSLSEGTYYYILTVRKQGATSTFKGAIAIVRQTNR